MKVICAGFVQTGTSTLAKALEILGYKVYSYDQHISLHMETWIAALKGLKKQLDFPSMYQDIEGLCDPPPCLYLENLMKAFPDARIILTVQDNDEQWLNSCREFLHPNYTGYRGVKQVIFEQIPRYLLFYLSPTMRKYVNHLETTLWKELLSTNDFDDGELMKWSYREHNESARLAVPCKQLLILNVKDGWQPLCDFLGCSVPDEPFPYKDENVSYTYQLLYRWSIGRKSFQEAINSLVLFVVFAFFVLLMAIMFN